MAPSRGKGKGAAKSTAKSSAGPSRRSKRGRQSADDDISDVYQSMLAEADAERPDDEERPLKRRRTAAPNAINRDDQTPTTPDRLALNRQVAQEASSEPGSALKQQQTVEDSSESDESEFEFEDVDLGQGVDSNHGSVDGIEDLSISIRPETSAERASHPRRKPVTTVEKAHRLMVHKLHVLCLLGHCMFINGRCNSETAQNYLRPILTAKTRSYLTPKRDDTQFQRNRSFMDGLQQAVNSFNAEYRVIGSGLIKPRWAVDEEPQARDTSSGPTDRSDFIEAAKNLEGSQDLGNQLFCALLRSIGVEVRVVCSLQPLPFTSVPKAPTPKKPAKIIIHAMPADLNPSGQGSGQEDATFTGSKSIGRVPSVRRRLGQPSFAESSKPITPKKAKAVRKLLYPVFWVEAFNEAHQKWVAVDPLVTNTINKSAKLEPPSSYDMGQMTYVIALESDGVVRDVTRRYAKAYNAKTRRHRVEASTDGAKWWKKVLHVFRRRGGPLDRDQVEDAELAQKEAREGMPANVLDFKDHPYYALGRHLRRHEVIHPVREVGKVNAGTAAKPRMEPVYRRQDLQVCRSADKWYRLGREIKEGEQPLKHVPARRSRQRSLDLQEGEDVAQTTALYAPSQTQLYIPPPVERGRIPKNVYGNLDIYVPSMVPAGGIHIRHHLSQRAAKMLKIHYADAVTGFKFQGRHGTAIIEGVVIAKQFAEALQAVITGIEEEIVEEESKARSLIALRLWKRFLAGLRIAERVSAYGKAPANEDESANTDEDEFPQQPALAPPLIDLDPLPTAGRFSLGELNTPSKPVKQRKRKVVDSDSEDDVQPELEGEQSLHADGVEFAGGFFADPDAEYRGRFQPKENIHDQDTDADDEGGGCVLEDNPDYEGGGGFLVEANSPGNNGAGFIDAQECDGVEGGFLRDDEENDDDLFGERDTPYATSAPAQVQKMPPKSTGEHDTIQQPQGTCEQETETLDRMEVDVQSVKPALVVAQSEPATTQQKIPSASSSDDESYRGSLLSHDPEDDDAEPDWLESD